MYVNKFNVEYLIELCSSIPVNSVNKVQFHKCQCYISDSWQDLRYIQSYNTRVALVDEVAKIVHIFGKYSPTTSKQVTRVINELFSEYEVIQHDITNW